MNDKERFYWMVGLLEGEGCFIKPAGTNLPRIEIEMVDEDVIARVAALLGTTVSSRSRKRVNAGGRLVEGTTYRTRLRGYRAIWLMHRMRPFMSARRRVQIDKALANSKMHPTRMKQWDFTQWFPLGQNGDFPGPRYEEADRTPEDHSETGQA